MTFDAFQLMAQDFGPDVACRDSSSFGLSLVTSVQVIRKLIRLRDEFRFRRFRR